MIGDSHYTAPLSCLGCGTGLDGHMEASPAVARRPTPGGAVICVHCSTIGLYTEIGGQLALRRPTDTELDSLLTNPAVTRAISVVREFRERSHR